VTRVGFIGLGAMGAPMARNLASAGFEQLGRTAGHDQQLTDLRAGDAAGDRGVEQRAARAGERGDRLRADRAHLLGRRAAAARLGIIPCAELQHSTPTDR
jgi:hypothetical protein